MAAERTGDYEWRIEGEETEVFLYAPDGAALEYPRLRAGIEAAAGLPGVEGPVYAAASPYGSGWAVSSLSHVAPGLVSAPRSGLLLVSTSPVDRLGLPPEEVPRLLTRRLSEVSIPSLGEAELRAACGSGFEWAAGEGFIEEEDLGVLGSEAAWGEPDALDRRALAAGVREWDPRAAGAVRPLEVGEILDSEAADALGVSAGSLVLVLSADSGELGRILLESHRQRILAREFGDSRDLAAAPTGTGEAEDLAAALGAASGYATARAALLVYSLRRALGDVTGMLEPVAAWSAGGLEERGGGAVHRRSLARLDAGESLVCGELSRGTGAMLGSAPTFDAGGGAEWPWEEAGLLELVARLGELGG